MNGALAQTESTRDGLGRYGASVRLFYGWRYYTTPGRGWGNWSGHAPEKGRRAGGGRGLSDTMVTQSPEYDGLEFPPLEQLQSDKSCFRFCPKIDFWISTRDFK
jgi:hypothetical protein